ncbi:MAG: stage II sporulation protein M [Streptococcaceae bacterium]|jgi:stage II sporulation protein M|nr:stage II sporulation protein M [Streptococcaceae bacterium]
METIKNLSTKLEKYPLLVGVCISMAISSLFFLIGINIKGFGVNLNVDKATFLEIFSHNSLGSLLLIMSVFTFGSITSLIVVGNFLFFGVKIRALISGFDIELLFQKVIAHGIIEIPSIILAASFGYYLLSLKILKKPVKIDKKFWFLFFRVIIVCLLLNALAAFVEAKVGMEY